MRSEAEIKKELNALKSEKSEVKKQIIHELETKRFTAIEATDQFENYLKWIRAVDEVIKYLQWVLDGNGKK